MIFYIAQVEYGNFQLFTNKKDALAYKKKHDWLDQGQNYEVRKVIIKNKKDVLDLVNGLSGGPDQSWDAFY